MSDPHDRNRPAPLPEDIERAGHFAQTADQQRAVPLLHERIHELENTNAHLSALLDARDQKIKELSDRVTERGLAVTWYDGQVAERETRIGILLAKSESQTQALAHLTEELEAIRKSKLWKVIAKGRMLGGMLMPPGSLRKRLLAKLLAREKSCFRTSITKHSDPVNIPTCPSLVEIVEIQSVEKPLSLDPAEPFEFPKPVDPYQRWLQNNRWNDFALLEARRTLESQSRPPLISVLTNVDDSTVDLLRTTIKCLDLQVNLFWELCVSRTGLGNHLPNHPKVRYQPLKDGEEPGNAAAEIAQGDWLLFLEPGDEIAPDSLLEIAHAATSNLQDPPVIISFDDDSIGAAGRREDPRFKPAWSPEFLLSCLYLGRSFCVRRNRFEALGGFRPGFEGAREYDLALRLTEDTQAKVVHVSRILAHLQSNRHSLTPCQGVRALQEALVRRGIEGRASRSDQAIREGIDIYQVDFPDDGPPVSILIPTKDRLDLLRRCIESILEKTSYRNYEIVVIDNDSQEPETLAYLDALEPPCRVERISNEGEKFSYARINNQAVSRLGSDQKFILFLNNDIEIQKSEWLSQLVGYAQIEGVGVVGARLLYPDGRIQHAGILTGLYGGTPGHAFKLAPWWDPGALHSAMVARNYSAVTAACLLTRRDLFQKLGGFDEKQFQVAYNDVDFCLRVQSVGLRTVYAPRAELFHFEGATRGFFDDPKEAKAYRQAWGRHVDPYYNPNLTTHFERFAIGTRRALPRYARSGRPLRALLWLPDLENRDATALLADLADGLRTRGRIRPEVVVSNSESPLAHPLRERGIPVHQRASDSSDLGSWILSQGFDVVHALTLNGQDAIEAARSASRPALWTILEPVDPLAEFRESGRTCQLKSLSQALDYAYQVTFTSWAVRRLYQPFNAWGHFATIPTSLDLKVIDSHIATYSKKQSAAILNASEARKIVSVVGSPTNPASLRDAALAILCQRHRDRRDTLFLLVGDVEDEETQVLADRSESIRLLPPDVDRLHLLRASDLFIAPLYDDGYPRVTLEAMGFGLPIVATRAHGLQEQIQANVNALTFAPGDVTKLADHLAALLPDEAQSQAKRQRLGQNARAFLEHLPTFQDMIDHYEQLLLEARAAGSPMEYTKACKAVHRGVA